MLKAEKGYKNPSSNITQWAPEAHPAFSLLRLFADCQKEYQKKKEK